MDSYPNTVFRGDVEILSRRKSIWSQSQISPDHHGNRNVGLKVWIFGMVERESNRLLLLSVE